MTSDRKDMDNSDYSLKWNNFTTNLTCGFISHLSDNELVDVTLAVEGKLLQAHKLVLSVCSPYFKEIFKVNPCTHPVVVLKGMGYSQIEALLQFMYRGEVNVSHNELSSFLKVAEELKVKGLAGDQSRSSDSRSGSSTPISCLETEDVQFDVATCSNPSTNTVETHPTSSDGNSTIKRPRESTTRARSLTPKKSRASPPALKEMAGIHFIKAKSEPEDFELQGDPYFLDEPLEEYLNSQQDTKKGFSEVEADGELVDNAASNSFTYPACSQGGEGTQEQNGGRVNRCLYLQGFVYHIHSHRGNKIYWRCQGRHKYKCRARCITQDSLVSTRSGTHTHAPEEPKKASYFLFYGERATFVEPVTYRLSARGRPQLVHEGYVYNLTSRSEVLNRSHYRCAEQHRGCRGKCAVIAERFMPTGVHEHNHPPGYQSEYEYRKKKGLDTDVI